MTRLENVAKFETGYFEDVAGAETKPLAANAIVNVSDSSLDWTIKPVGARN